MRQIVKYIPAFGVAFLCATFAFSFSRAYAKASEPSIDVSFQWKTNRLTEKDFSWGACVDNVSAAVGELCQKAWHRKGNGQTLIFIRLVDDRFLFLIL